MVDYELLSAQIRETVQAEPWYVPALSNVSALLMETLPDLNWAGFYVQREGRLVLGPFQGKPACIHIAFGKGVPGGPDAERAGCPRLSRAYRLRRRLQFRTGDPAARRRQTYRGSGPGQPPVRPVYRGGRSGPGEDRGDDGTAAEMGLKKETAGSDAFDDRGCFFLSRIFKRKTGPRYLCRGFFPFRTADLQGKKSGCPTKSKTVPLPAE